MKKNRRAVMRWGGTILAIVMLFIMFREVKWNDVFEAVKRVSLKQFLLALGLITLSRLFVSGRWHVLMRSGGNAIAIKDSVALTYTGLFASQFLPTTVGGDVVRFTGAIQMGFDRAISLASLVTDRLIGMIGMVLLLPFALAFLLQGGAFAPALSVAPIFGKALEFFKKTFASFSVWLKKPKSLFVSLLFQVGNVASNYAAFYMLIKGINNNISYWLVVSIMAIIYFATLLPISFNGYGIQEFSLTYLFSRFGGLDHSESVSVALLIRALQFLATTPGAAFLPSVLADMARAQINPNEINDL